MDGRMEIDRWMQIDGEVVVVFVVVAVVVVVVVVIGHIILLVVLLLLLVILPTVRLLVGSSSIGRCDSLIDGVRAWKRCAEAHWWFSRGVSGIEGRRGDEG